MDGVENGSNTSNCDTSNCNTSNCNTATTEVVVFDVANILYNEETTLLVLGEGSHQGQIAALGMAQADLNNNNPNFR